MPAEFSALGRVVDVDRREVIGVRVDLVDVEDGAQKCPKGIVAVDIAQGRVGRDLIVGDQTLGTDDLAVGGVALGS